MDKIPAELYPMIFINIEPKDLINFCTVEKKVLNYCKSNKILLLKNHIKKANDLSDYSYFYGLAFLFKNEKELREKIYELAGQDLIVYLDEEFPIEYQDDYIFDFGKFVAKNWKKFITGHPTTTLRNIAHFTKYKELKPIIKELYNKTPKTVREQVVEEGEDFFNTDTANGRELYNYFVSNLL